MSREDVNKMLKRKEFQSKPYQDIIVDKLIADPRCAIWAGMGMGKTVSTLTAVDHLQLMGESFPTLVLAPLLVARTTWVNEPRKWQHLSHISVVPVVGSEKEKIQALKLDAPIYATNYESLPWLVDYYGDRWPFGRVVADESTRLKGFRTKQGGQRAKALGRVAHTKVKFFNQLTGTPAPNGLIDLWGQMWMLDGGARLGRSYTAFVERWFRPAHDGGAPKPFAHTADEINAALADICLSLQPEDWFDLRKPIVVNRYVDLPVKARIKYQEMEKTFYMELDKHPVEAANSAVRTQKLLQVANGAAYVDPLVESDDNPKSKEWKQIHDVKLQELESIANEFSGAQLLVAYSFRSDRDRLVKAFPKGRCIDKKNPNKTERDWNDGKIPMLFVHPKSAGHGLNFQQGGYVIVFFGHNWNLEERLQVIERIGPVRQMQSGFERNVYIINIIARDTVDELVMARVATKKSVQDLILEARSTKRNRGI